jgi:predicted nucleic acid-binding protein
MTRVELLSAFDLTKQDEKQINDFFFIIPVIPYNDVIEHNAILIRRNTHIKIPDAYVCSTALFIKGTLITNDNQLLKLNWSGLKVKPLIP